ncbi:MAG TPA: dynamin family protein, partial [Candidatus Sulfotelmatobacter sp.]|nr:dynamin family protein [Candidatus Sulfotelmatobacter sp.]
MELLEAEGASQAVEDLRGLLARLAEDRFNLVVVGQFKRGKSTLMNAVIGRDVLPSGVVPLTSAITALCYGPRDAVWLRRRGWTFEQQIPMAELADYVTEPGNPGNEKGLLEARVELPLPFLRRGLYFIDTPGIGSVEPENTRTTYAFLPQADAVIFVTSVEAALSEAEGRFLQTIREHDRNIFIVVNKVDLVGGDDRADVLRYIERRLMEVLERPHVPVFPVSARMALEARAGGDGALLQDSGLPAFEAALGTFLTREQGRTFLLATLERLRPLLAETPEPSAGAGGPAGDRLRLADLRGRASAVTRVLLSGGALRVETAGGRAAAGDAGLLTRAAERSLAQERPTSGGHPVRPEMCGVCEAQTRAVFDFFVGWQHEVATNAAARRAFAAARGFCPGHTWQFQQIAAPRDLSAAYAPLLDDVIAALQKAVDETPRRAAGLVGEVQQSQERCAACRVSRDVERSAIAGFLEPRPAQEKGSL